MYIIEVNVGGAEFTEDVRNVYVEDYKQLERVVSLILHSKYILYSVKKLDLEYAKDFIKMLKRDSKPKDLVFGKKKGRK